MKSNPPLVKDNRGLIPTVLLYNFRPDERTSALEAYLVARSIHVRYVRPSEFNQRIGTLVAIPGFQNKPAQFGPLFSEEMLVMSAFSQDDLNDFLRFFQTRGLKKVEFKALLTPTNAFWSGIELRDHLAQEQEQLEKNRR